MENMLLPDDLSVRCPALKWRTCVGRPYVELLGWETILNAPCWKAAEVKKAVVVQTTETVFEEISPVLLERVVDYFEASVNPEICRELGRGVIFRPFYASERYDKRKKVVPAFPISELFGKDLRGDLR